MSNASDKPRAPLGIPAHMQYDVRVIPRNIVDGVLKTGDVDAFIEALPDVAAKSDGFRTPRPGQPSDAGNDDLDEQEE